MHLKLPVISSFPAYLNSLILSRFRWKHLLNDCDVYLGYTIIPLRESGNQRNRVDMIVWLLMPSLPCTPLASTLPQTTQVLCLGSTRLIILPTMSSHAYIHNIKRIIPGTFLSANSFAHWDHRLTSLLKLAEFHIQYESWIDLIGTYCCLKSWQYDSSVSYSMVTHGLKKTWHLTHSGQEPLLVF